MPGRQSKSLLVVTLFAIVVAQGQALFGERPGYRAIFLLPFLFAIAATSAIVIRPRNLAPNAVLALWAYLAVVTVTVLRSIGTPGTTITTRNAALTCIQFIVVAWFGYRLLASAQTDDERWSRLVAVALAPAVFVAFNVLIITVRLPFITVPAHQATVSGTATILGSFGAQILRSYLPLTNGLNSSGAISGAGFAAAAVLALRVRRPSRMVTVPLAALCLYAALLSDSRAALILAAGVVLLFAVLPRSRRFTGISALAVLSPAILITVLGLVSSFGLSLISRGSGDIATADSRLFIWQAAWSAIKRSDLLHLLVGYGGYGQLTSGASLNYAYLFLHTTGDAYLNTVHDLFLQTVLDGGIVALAVLVLFYVAVFSSLSAVAAKAPSPPVQALMAITIVLLLNGATEALPSYLFPESLDVMLLVAGAALALAPQAVVEPGRRPERAAVPRVGIGPSPASRTG